MNARTQRFGQETVENEVRGVADAWTAAERRGDIARLDGTLVEDFVGIGPRGFLLTKEEWLARHRTGDLKYESFELADVRVRLYRDTAVLTARQVAKATYRGQSVPGQFRATLVFVKEAERWLLAGLHLSPIVEGA